MGQFYLLHSLSSIRIYLFDELLRRLIANYLVIFLVDLFDDDKIVQLNLIPRSSFFNCHLQL